MVGHWSSQLIVPYLPFFNHFFYKGIKWLLLANITHGITNNFFSQFPASSWRNTHKLQNGRQDKKKKEIEKLYLPKQKREKKFLFEKLSQMLHNINLWYIFLIRGGAKNVFSQNKKILIIGHCVKQETFHYDSYSKGIEVLVLISVINNFSII